MRKILIIFFLSIIQVSFGQDLNSYRYVIIPVDYDFLKEQNQYQLADLTKFLFEKEGFKTHLENEVPEDLKKNNCEALRAEVEEDSGLFVTRLIISLQDCNNKEIFRTTKGTSRLKDYERAYHEALREAFNSIAALDYSYQEVENVVEVTAIPQQQEPTVKGEVKQTIPDKEEKEKEPTQNLIDLASEELIFSMDNAVYYLKKTSSGFNFYQKGMAEPFASLIKSSAGDSFIYSSVTAKGVANFSPNGDLVVELLDADNGELNKRVYTKQHQ